MTGIYTPNNQQGFEDVVCTYEKLHKILSYF